MAFTARVKTNLVKDWLPKTVAGIDAAVAEIATDIHRGASILAPYDKGGLVNSGRVDHVAPGHYAVTFGNETIPYARRRHFENKKNPGSLRYLERAGDSIARGDVKKYLKDK